MAYQRVTSSDSFTTGATAATTVINAVEAGLEAVENTNIKTLGLASGTDDTTTIQNALTAAAGSIVRGVPGQSYVITAPIVIRSNTTLDMTGCTITLQTSSNCNMVNNRAVSTAQRSISDAAITTGTNTLTSATASFTTNDTGRTIVVTGAGPNSGMFALSAIMTYVNSTTVTLDANAGATVTGATAVIYDRDVNIRIIGGTWDRGNNGGSGDAQHSLFLRRIDGLLIDIDTFKSTGSGPKYAVHPGDVTNFNLSVRSFAHVSDGIHVRGPARNGVVRNVGGFTSDDLVVFGSSDNSRISGGAGDISDVHVYDIHGGSSATVKMYGNSGTSIKRINIDGVRCATAGPPIYVGATDITGVTLSQITIQNVVSMAAVGISVNASGDTLTLRNITCTNATSSNVVYVVKVATGATWTNISAQSLSAPNMTSCAGGSSMVSVDGTVTDLMLMQSQMTGTTSQYILGLGGSGSTVTRAHLSQISLSGNSTTMVKSSSAGAILGEVYMSSCYANGSSFLLDTAATTIWHIHGVRLDSPSNGSCIVRATGNLTILGSDASKISGNITTTAGYALKVNCSDFPVDISKITSASAGDRAQNTASATGILPGSGPVIYNGSAWLRADLSAVKNGTATLVAGTVTVSDTAITANSVIRLTNKTAGGTVGAPYISARTVGTGFTITSTNASDTSVIQYDILSY